METKPADQPGEPADAGAAETANHLLEDRADRTRFVHGLIMAAMVVVGVAGWPTESRKLERHAKDYLSAAFKGDPKKAYQFLAPESRERLRMDVWWAANHARLANSEVEAAEVDASGQAAVVTLRDTRSKVLRPTAWVKQDGTWYHRYEGRQ